MADNTLLQLPCNAVRLGIERDRTSINIDELNRFDQTINNRYDHSILGLTDINPDTNFLSTDNVQSMYFSGQTFNEKYRLNKNLSLFNCNVRSIQRNFNDIKLYLNNYSILFQPLE